MTEKFLIDMKTFFENIDKLKKNLEEEISRVELERNDLLHELELGKLNAIQLTRVSIVLRDVLRERRKYKNEWEKIYILKGFTDKYNNKFITGDIVQTLKKLKELEESQEKRIYTPRIIKDLKCAKVEKDDSKN